MATKGDYYVPPFWSEHIHWLERGTRHENPSIFNPIALDASQWVSVAEDAGISLVVLTAKHHDGFCLWPSKYTEHTVGRSHWKNGNGDVVQELVNAAKPRRVDVGLCLSPRDRHGHRYGMEKPYNEYYLTQLQELLTRYGGLREIWFDGFKGEHAPNMSHYITDWFSMVKELQPCRVPLTHFLMLVRMLDGLEMNMGLPENHAGQPSIGPRYQLGMQELRSNLGPVWDSFLSCF